MSLVVDYSLGYDINTLKAKNVSAVCRYIGYTAWSLPQNKIIVYKEAYDLAQAGIAIVSNFEWYNTRTSEGFGAGVADAQAAAAFHKSIGGPDTAPIYFSADYNTDGVADADYFRGVVSVIGLARTGVYGPYAAVKYLHEQGVVTWLWQTYVWSGGQWYPGVHLKQVQNAVQMGNMAVDYDSPLATNFGQWMLPPDAPKPVWYQYPICVPFGNSNFDSGLGGSHDLDVAPPPNLPVTSIVSGLVSDISAPDWGKQVGIKLDSPINGIGYFHYLHLSATNPALSLGSRVNVGDLIGWVGGGNSQADYQGTTNPTGQNFLNSTNSSSRIQAGIALMDGPAYGGPGWVNFPPIDMALDPTPTLQAARNAFNLVTPPQQGDVDMHFSTRAGENDRVVFITAGRPLTLHMGSDFGTASVRLARKHSNNSWSVDSLYTVDSTKLPISVALDSSVVEVSLVVSALSSPDTVVGIDIF